MTAAYALKDLEYSDEESIIGKILSSRYCGKCVCDECSGVFRQLSKTDTKKYRVCDECDETLISKKVREAFDKLLQRKAEELVKKSKHMEDLLTQKTADEETLNKLEMQGAEKDNRIEAVKKEYEAKKATKQEFIKMYKSNKILSAKEIENQKSILRTIESDTSTKSSEAQSLKAHIHSLKVTLQGVKKEQIRLQQDISNMDAIFGKKAPN